MKRKDEKNYKRLLVTASSLPYSKTKAKSRPKRTNGLESYLLPGFQLYPIHDDALWSHVLILQSCRILKCRYLFCSSHFSFLVFGHFWQQSYKNTKILCNLCLHFARQDEQDRKKCKQNHTTTVTKILKSKRWK